MKSDIHPKYHEKAKVTCACGNTFEIGSTVPEIHVELCSNCHPFFTGKQKLIDTSRRVEKFQERIAKKDVAIKTRAGRTSKTDKNKTKKAKRAK